MIFDSAYERGDYDFLYANYLDETHDLLTVALKQLLEGTRFPETVIDLCAGTGHFTQALVSSGMQVLAVDKSPAMLDRLQRKVTPRYALTTKALDLNQPGALDWLPQADLITCCQGIGYLNRDTLIDIPKRLSPVGGVFLFNTFVEPPKHQLWRHRRKDGIYEAGFYAFGKVYHLQARWPRLDFTRFYWHDPDVLAGHWRRQGFRVETSRVNRTIIVGVHRP